MRASISEAQSLVAAAGGQVPEYRIAFGRPALHCHCVVIPVINEGARLHRLLERMAAFHRDLESLGITRADVVETTARIVHQTVTGREG